MSLNTKEHRWIRRNHLYNRQYSASDGPGLFLTSPDLAQAPQWTPPAIQEITVDDYDETSTRRGRVMGKLPSTPTMEGTSGDPDSSASSPSDSGLSEPTFYSCLSSNCNLSSRRSFLSKPIHPLSYSSLTPREASDSIASGFTEFDATTPPRDAHRWSSASSSTEFADISEPFDSEVSGRFCISSDDFKCGLCERLLSQRSPWSSRRIMRSGDMPVAGVLSCCHVFHAECLEQTTPKARKIDPPCPLCARLEENSPEYRLFSKVKNSFPRRPFSEDGPSKPWGCVQMGDCVEGAVNVPQVPQRNTVLLLNRNRIRRNLALKGNSSKEFPGRLRKSGSHSSKLSGKLVDVGAVGCSKTLAGSSMKR